MTDDGFVMPPASAIDWNGERYRRLSPDPIPTTSDLLLALDSDELRARVRDLESERDTYRDLVRELLTLSNAAARRDSGRR